MNTSRRSLAGDAFGLMALVASMIAPANAQTAESATARLSFAVASVKPRASDSKPSWSARGDRFTATAMHVDALIRIAFGEPRGGSVRQLAAERVVGLPSWVGREAFDVTAVAPAGPRAPGDILRMLQTLLVERFALRAHTETREVPIYRLVKLRPNGNSTRGLRSVDKGALNAIRSGPGRVTSAGTSLATVAGALSTYAGRPVVDGTDLSGFYAVDLQWTPTSDQMPQRLAGRSDLPVELGGPSFFTAVEEQLGLKLEARRGDVTVVVVDRIGRPTPD